jgi:hypothetical protein
MQRGAVVGVLLALSACGDDGLTVVREAACERLAAQRTVELVRDDEGARTWSITLALSDSVRPENNIGSLVTPTGWVARAAWMKSPGIAESPVRVKLNATDATGTLGLEFAAPPSVDPQPKTATVDVVLTFEPNDVGPTTYMWKSGPLTIGPCD